MVACIADVYDRLIAERQGGPMSALPFRAFCDRDTYYVGAGAPNATSIMWKRDSFNVALGRLLAASNSVHCA